ncbi:uncharacterized protein DUF3263 [Rhodococcus wratislaviensis]|uniref:Uncharacterized protein n=1 Tax=Rhodococcus wratislaviensis TaxID=44752 RepID=A0AB38FD79_RHOWR|nr:DUF3263 domain-containing protein [Rhodococcus wratislaviensis]REE75476.1 uncharacterized protein DUF3263 [Rhodococcus wratislaviensis]SPZ39489.1 Uncharacterised protein [Rhodococcus wratislaviensis]
MTASTHEVLQAEMANRPADMESDVSRDIEGDIKVYRRWRDRRRVVERRRQHHPKVSREAEEILDFARRWAPFGGVPEDETFERFGMSTHRFKERLQHIVNTIEGIGPRSADL